MKKLLVAMMLVWSVGAVVNAAEMADDGVDVTFDVTYASKYLWRGFNLFGENGAMQPSLDVALDNGLSFNVWASYPQGSGAEDATEYDYTVAYSNTVLEDSVWKTDYSVGWRYYDLIKLSSDAADMQEIFVEAEMPALVGGGMIPHLAWYQMWEGDDGATAYSKLQGAILVMGFDYNFTLDQAPELPMTFTWDLVYNDGTGVVDIGSDVDHDWSHMVCGLSTSMTCPATGGTLTPAVYFQNTFDDSVNPRGDELFATLSYTFSF